MQLSTKKDIQVSNFRAAHFTMKFNCGNAISITAGGRARHAYIMPGCVLKIVEPAFHRVSDKNNTY